MRYRALFLLCLLWANPSWAAITIDAASSSGGTSSTSHSHTIAGNLVLICLAVRDSAGAVAAATSVTVGGQAATLLDAQTNPNNVMRVELWYKLAPLTGVQTIAATGDATTDAMVTGAISLNGVAQTSTFNTVVKAQATGTNVDLDAMSSAVGELGVLCGAARGTATTASADATVPVSTEQFDRQQGCTTCAVGFGYTEDGASSTINMRVDLSESVQWAAVGASVRPDLTTSVLNRGVVFFP